MSEENFKRNFRFPAFNDEAGVKLPLPRRDLFQKNLMTDRNVDLTPVHEPHARRTPENPIVEDTIVPEDRPARRTMPVHAQTFEPAVKNANNTGAKTRKERYHGLPEKRTMPVGGPHVKETFNKPEPASTSYQKPADRYQGRSYFVPKYVPASLIQEEEQHGITNDELMASLKKPRASYLNFTEEEEILAPIEEEKHNFVRDVPESDEHPKKKAALEKSLAGILQDENEQAPMRNRYFEK